MRPVSSNRWIVLLAACVIQTVLGGLYAWSLFVPRLMTDHALSAAQCGLIFGLTIFVFTATMVAAGRLMTRRGPRLTAAIGAVLFGGGHVLASFSGGAFLPLLFAIGCVAGAGIGFAYVCPLDVCMRWFPRHKGLVTGIAVAGFGGGAVLLATIAETLLRGGMDVLVFFRWQGVCAGLILLIIGNLNPLARQAGLDIAQAARAVSVFALGNALGRMAWGGLADRFKDRTIPLSLACLAASAALLLLPLSPNLFIPAAGLLGFGFGANFVVYAAAVVRTYGVHAFPRLYPLCFLAYGVAGIIGPTLGGHLRDATGSHTPAILLCVGIVALTGVLTTRHPPAVAIQTAL